MGNLKNVFSNGSSLELSRVRFAQIETSTLCNYRCPFCQVAYESRPRRMMTRNEFAWVVDQLSALRSLEKIYLNGYNEPSIVPDLVDQVRLAAKLGCEIILLTNGTGLTERKCLNLAKASPRVTIDIHLSAVSPREYKQVHGVALSSRLLPTLHAIAERPELSAITLCMMVMGVGDDRHEKNWREVQSFFSGTRMQVEMDVVHDRAGALPPPYGQAIDHKVAYGCSLENRPFEWVHITASGNWILCCQDYKENHVFGNVFENNIRKIASSRRRKKVIESAFGISASSESSICTRCQYAIVDEQNL